MGPAMKPALKTTAETVADGRDQRRSPAAARRPGLHQQVVNAPAAPSTVKKPAVLHVPCDVRTWSAAPWRAKILGLCIRPLRLLMARGS
ncbi:hypothetical protein [Streptomyces sp. NPDC097610]|uniref:hypothetical protein n=1 Tax=Streptomyces sp. NPDC097610 TaxID=3157227 RepID=UPI003324C71C